MQQQPLRQVPYVWSRFPKTHHSISQVSQLNAIPSATVLEPDDIALLKRLHHPPGRWPARLTACALQAGSYYLLNKIKLNIYYHAASHY